MTVPTPLLDFFRRGDVARDIRLLAAEGALAPRPYEQLAILVLLVSDVDPEIASVAEATLGRIPRAALQRFLVTTEVGEDLRAFFASRGVAVGFQAPSSPEGSPVEVDADDPLELEGPSSDGAEPGEQAADLPASETVARMSFMQKLKAAMKGSRELRSVLVRDSNKVIATAVLSSPKLTESEVESFAKMTSVSEEVLRIIASTRTWTKHYGVVAALARNPKTPIALALNLTSRLNYRDLLNLSTDRNVPDPVRVSARKRVTSGR